MKKLIALAALAATTATAQTAQPGFTPPRPCLTAIEAKNLATFVLPGLLDEVSERCRGSLARDAFLRQPASISLSQRLRRDAGPSWPVAKAAIEKLNGQRLPGLFGEGFVKTVAEGAAADLTLKDFDKADCAATNDLVFGLSPLPSENFSSVIASIIALGANANDEKAPLRICPSIP